MSPSGLHFHISEIDSTWPIKTVSAIKFKGLYCFFGCHGNNVVYLFWSLLRNSIIPENLKRLCSWFSEIKRKRISTWFEYCSCDVILASFPFKKWLLWRLAYGTLKWNISRTRRGIYKLSTAFVLFSSALSSQTNFLFGWTFPLTFVLIQSRKNYTNIRPRVDFPFNVCFDSIAQRLIVKTTQISDLIKGKVHPKNMLVSDVRSDKIGKNAVDRFSLSPLVLKM